MTASDTFEDLGPNSGLVEEMYRQFLDDPTSVSESWRDFFADYTPRAEVAAQTPPSPAAEVTPAAAAPRVGVPIRSEPAATPAHPAGPPVVLDGEEPKPLYGAGARIVENMEASIGVPTATSVRTIPAKLLEVNRQILNNHLRRIGAGKVSFTHLIAFALVRALEHVPAMNVGFGVVDGKPMVVQHDHVNLGLAVDVQKKDGSRTLLVPNIKSADTLNFAAFFATYEDLIRKVRSGKIAPDDFAGTTCSLTNPGMIGTVSSVPRLMPGQGFILGAGSIGFPAEYEGADPQTLARVGVSKVVTLTSTYDHRVVQGAESGEFLRWIHQLLLGAEGFYDGIFQSFAVPYEPARWSTDDSPLDDQSAMNEKVVAVHQLINMYRVRGHLIANLDPLGRREPYTHPELDISHYGLTIWDLDREFPTGSLAVKAAQMKLGAILGVLRDAYARTVGVEFMHIQEPDQKNWIQERVERPHDSTAPDEQRRILERLNAAEAFERFLATKYLGHKRFGLEGAESLIPMLDALLSTAADAGMQDAVLGMAHRGRLNVLANVMGKSYMQIFREFEGQLDPTSAQGSGDVKYHLGAVGKHQSPAGHPIDLTLASNPSHLEAVDPVVEGMARAKQDRIADTDGDKVLSVLIHGDAAFAGQGVVAETLNLSEVPGYEVGGTVHIVVNNQLGFTTAPELGRSSVYATDVAKMVQAPVFHVNGDDPEACVRVMRLAFDFRQAFRKDVVVDLVCYRRHGHNETDEPAFTQPRMYALIGQHRSVRKLYTEVLVNRGDLTLAEAEAALDDFKHRLDVAFEETHQTEPPRAPERLSADVTTDDISTGVPREELATVVAGLRTRPEGFHIHPKLERILANQHQAFEDGTVDWALAEQLAFGSLVLEGTPVRLAGQDTRRGTFSQRHAVLVDVDTEQEYAPLDHLEGAKAPFMIYDSVLSEFAALGFDYGYSVEAADTLVAWEAQFGDFVNGAQTIIDQFIVAAEDKWGQRSALAMLLPHGFEGQGPDHSSARLERFLTLSADDNIRVVYPSTAAQYFHVLRRQVRTSKRRPLVCLTPKRYLRMPQSRSHVSELLTGSFQRVLDDRGPIDAAAVERVVFCSGKIAHELMDRRDRDGAPVAIVRLEQLYPVPSPELEQVLARYANASELWWAQEEPENMGAWNFVRSRLPIREGAVLQVAARTASASPASGSQTVHEQEQEALLVRVIGAATL